MQHLYQGYKNLISRILEQKSASHHDLMPRSSSNLSAHHRGVTLAQSAVLRFERLSDRIELLILSEIQEFLAEKDALISTVRLPPPSLLEQKDEKANQRYQVLQHHSSKRFRSHRTPHPRRDAAGQTLCALPSRLPHDGILLHPDQRSRRRVHDQRLLVRVCDHHDDFSVGIVLLCKGVDVDYRDIG